MTVYLKGKNGRVDQVEKNVVAIAVDEEYINLKYNVLQWGIVSGVSYPKDEMEIEKVTAK